MTRQEANYEILDVLKDFVKSNPDLRFGQLLTLLNIVESVMMFDDETQQLHSIWYDEFYTESEEILERIRKIYPKEEI